MKRRVVLKVGAAAAGATLGSRISAPALAQGLRRLRLATTWPKTFPGLGDGAQRFADRVAAATGGRITIEVHSAGELVPAFEVFDAVGRGDIDIYHGSEVYWETKALVYNFFSAVPLGMTSHEINAWILHGGGQEMWDSLSANFNVKPMICGNTTVQMAGWFQDEINSLEDLTAQTIRIAGLGAEVLRQVGGDALTVPGGEIVEAMQTRKVDACEFMGPWVDQSLGLHKVARYYYYPGFHQPGEAIAVGINLDLWNQLTDEEQSIFQSAAHAENTTLLAEFNARNGAALEDLITNHGVEVRRLDRAIFRALALASRDVVADVGRENDFSRRVYNSFVSFRQQVARWTELSDQAYVEARSRYL
jgi:TRAP-type mannitol/chloroaromatic compound transport system substrate-binding protein